LLIECKEP